MALNSLAQELLAIAAVPDDGNLVALVGDAVSFAPQQTFAAPTVTLTRKPAGSAAAVAANSITFDLAGYYTVTIAAGGFTRNATVFTFPVNVTAQKAKAPDPNSGNVTRGHLAQLIRDPRVTLANITATLEVASPFVGSAIVGGGPFSWGAYL